MSLRASSVSGWLERIPLPARMVVYSTSFLAVVLVGLPWLAYRIDVRWPHWHVEIGAARIVGVLILLTCGAVYAYSSYVLSRHGRGAYVEFDPPHEFVALGPYRRTRNPIAASLCGMILGIALGLSSTGVFVLFLLSLPVAHAQVVWLEEPLLRSRFGTTYETYLRRVPRWLPRLPKKEPR